MVMERMERLRALASNLWWSWDADATAMWAEVDPFRWEKYGHNPVALVQDVEPERWQELLTGAFGDRVDQTWRRFRAYLEAPSWCERAAPELLRHGVAYFSMEFGIHESLRLYSGGLGVLAGDHVRSASDLGVPLVGVSLLYRHGYFRQILEEGRQLAAFFESTWSRLPIHPCRDLTGKQVEIVVPIEDRAVRARLWQVDVGRSRLVLLDTDYDANPDQADRELTRQLYGGDEKLRIRQEVLLGMGGVRALRELRVKVGVYHLNEGHCAFVPMALVGEKMALEHQTYEVALAEVKKRCVFTTHTPVPAGHDRFSWDLVDGTLGPWRDSLGLQAGAIMDLGRVRPGDWEETMCMTVLALRTTAAANGVSALHGHVSRKMWHALWPKLGVDQVPIGHITNGVHPTAWMAPEAQALYDRYIDGWRERIWDHEVWAAVERIPDEALWSLRAVLRQRLADGIRTRAGRSFDPDALTIGFARRFAPYKRGNLLFRDPKRLKAMLDRVPMQLVFAGKAHPRDTMGQDIVAEVIRHSEHRDFRDRVVLLQDYDIALGRLVTMGSDVWLNNPRRPHEASGTSGQKVTLNGGINLSVLDGWWPEAYDGTNGWAIGKGEELPDAEQDALDSESLYRTLEERVLPEWTEREGGLPRRWIARMRRSIMTCIPLFTSHRMVRDYALEMYAPRCR
jgi:glycogen phosphorylase